MVRIKQFRRILLAAGLSISMIAPSAAMAAEIPESQIETVNEETVNEETGAGLDADVNAEGLDVSSSVPEAETAPDVSVTDSETSPLPEETPTPETSPEPEDTPTPEVSPTPEETPTPGATPTPEVTPTPSEVPDVVTTPEASIPPMPQTTPVPPEETKPEEEEKEEEPEEEEKLEEGDYPLPNPIKLVKKADIDPRSSFKRVEKVYGIIQAETAVNIREEADTDCRVVGRADPEALVYILKGQEEEWLYIESGDVRGFIKKDFVRFGAEADAFVEEKGEENLKEAKAIVSLRDNKAFDYTTTTVYEVGTQTGDDLIEYAKGYADDSEIIFRPVEICLGLEDVVGEGTREYKRTKSKDVKIQESKAIAIIEKLLKEAQADIEAADGNMAVSFQETETDGNQFVWSVLDEYDLAPKDCPKAYSDWKKLGEEVKDLQDIRPGDVVVYEDQVALYDGEGKILEVSSEAERVIHEREVDAEEIQSIRRFVQDEVEIVGNTNAETVFNYLVSKGWSKEAAAGAVGNMFQESGGGGSADINPASHGSGGRGIAGFTYSPDAGSNDDGMGLVRYAKSVNKDWTDLQMQCDYMILCLQGNWGRMWNSASVTGNQLRAVGYQVPSVSFQQFTQMTDVNEAALVFLASYENCGLQNARTKARLMMANVVYQSFR